MPINEADLKKSLETNGKYSGGIKQIDGIQSDVSRDTNEDILIFAKENNRLLRKLLSHQRWNAFFSFIKIIIFIVPIVVAYMYLPPILEELWNNYQSIIGSVNTLQQGAKVLDNANMQNLNLNNIDLNKVQKLLK